MHHPPARVRGVITNYACTSACLAEGIGVFPWVQAFYEELHPISFYDEVAR